MFSLKTITATIALATLGSAFAEPAITAAAQLVPRQRDPALVGYISLSGTISSIARSCDYPQTVSTSGGYVQCCSPSGSCPFYTQCRDNTLIGAGVTVSCDVNTALTCNTAIVQPSTGQGGGPNYLACWQKTLGSNPFTIVQNVAASATGTSGGTSATSSGNTASITSTSGGSTMTTGSGSGASASSSSSRAAAAANNDGTLSGGLLGGAMALVAQLLL